MSLLEDNQFLPDLENDQIHVGKPLRTLSKGYKAGTIKRMRKQTIDSYRTKARRQIRELSKTSNKRREDASPAAFYTQATKKKPSRDNSLSGDSGVVVGQDSSDYNE